MKLLLLLLAPAAAFLQVGEEANATPQMLSNEYATRLPHLASMDVETLRKHIRQDLLPRLMGGADDITTVELGINTFEKMHSALPSLVQLKEQSGQRISAEELHEKSEALEDVDRDITLMSKKIEEDANNPVASDVLRLMTNSLKGFECAFRATEVHLVSGKAPSSCQMPFPGSLIMLGQKVEVPAQFKITLPDTSDPAFLKPQEWMADHMRRTMWCPDSFSRNGFDSDVVCNAVVSALDMPRREDLENERSAFAQITGSSETGAPLPGATALLESSSGAPGTVKSSLLSSKENTARDLQEATNRRKILLQKETELDRRLSVHQKRARLAELKKQVAQDEAKLIEL